METTETTEAVLPVMEVKTYWGFRWRLLAYIIDTGFSILLVPILINIYYYYKEGTTIWYKATWLIIKKSQDETTKPWWRRLLGRFLAKSLFSLVIVWVVWFIISIIFWLINILTWWLWEYLTIIKWVVNWLLWILAFLSFFWFFSWITIPFNKRKRGLHDLLAKTVVVRTWLLNKRLLIIGCILFILSVFLNIISTSTNIENLQRQLPADLLREAQMEAEIQVMEDEIDAQSANEQETSE